ncbi:MAG: hypothetical protein ABSF32_12260 [Ignavibacteria bacterium]
MENNEKNIIKDIKKIAGLLKKKPGDIFGKREYVFYPGSKLNHYSLYKEGKSWEYYCQKAGFKTERKPKRTDDYYFRNLQKAVNVLGRLPKFSERRKFDLGFSARRWPSLGAFIKDAVESKKVKINGYTLPAPVHADNQNNANSLSRGVKFFTVDIPPLPIPPVPLRSKRETWIRTNISGFPYAPHDELGVAALFAVLCSKYLIPWQVVELNYGTGIDCICYHSSKKYEIRVEFKFVHNKSNWNHDISTLDYVVCWENKWKDFPKPVLELKSLLSTIRSC